jgi:hypothetical protein
LRTPKKKAAPKRRYKEMENLILRHPVLAVKPQRRANPHEREARAGRHRLHRPSAAGILGARNQIGPTWLRWRLTVEMPEMAKLRQNFPSE